MDVRFMDRELKCFDCGGVFVFTAGEQVFFSDKQFKNDPKRCKPCKAKRFAVSPASVAGTGAPRAALQRTETRTECSACQIQTTVPFKPTQGRPVLCRECFRAKGRSEVLPVKVAPEIALHVGSLVQNTGVTAEEAVQMSSAVRNAVAHSSIATAAEMASIADVWPTNQAPRKERSNDLVLLESVGPAQDEEPARLELLVEETEGILA